MGVTGVVEASTKRRSKRFTFCWFNPSWEPEPESEEFTFCSRKCLEDFIHKRRA